MDLIDDDESARLSSQKCIRIPQPALIDGSLEIQVQGLRLARRSNIARERGFSYLAWAKQEARPASV